MSRLRCAMFGPRPTGPTGDAPEELRIAHDEAVLYRCDHCERPLIFNRERGWRHLPLEEVAILRHVMRLERELELARAPAARVAHDLRNLAMLVQAWGRGLHSLDAEELEARLAIYADTLDGQVRLYLTGERVSDADDAGNGGADGVR